MNVDENRRVGDRRVRGKIVCALVLVCLTLCISVVAAQEGAKNTLPENPLQGRLLFERKHCNQCHSITKAGVSLGPDLGAGHFAGSFFDMGSSMWNHVPGMGVRFESTGLTWPQLSDHEVMELTAFLYYIDYLGRPGDPVEGRRLFSAKGCSSCHNVGQGGEKRGPDLSRLEQFASPLYVAQAIWNHGPGMLQSMQEMKMQQPRFKEGDLADLSAYLRGLAGDSPVTRMLLSPGNPTRGRDIFDSRGCSECHAAGGSGGGRGPDLSRSDLHRSAEAIAGNMWNHATAMIALMRDQGIGWPSLSSTDLADLIAFLYFLPFTDPLGDADLGREVFAKSCAHCHSDSPVSGHRGPDLEDTEVTQSPEGLVAAMWNHAPVMKEAILGEGRPWPELSGPELRNLFAYLRDARGRKQQP